jgi:hypothetical protein
LDLTKAPFRLLAIVNHLDLRSSLFRGVEQPMGAGAGNASFVFCACRYDACDPMKAQLGNPIRFTVSFEFQIKRKDFAEVREWADQWYALKDIPQNNPRYNKALQKITDQFTAAGANPEGGRNQSALAQLRTNEDQLDAGALPQWEMREFQVNAKTGYLQQVTVTQTPRRPAGNNPAVEPRAAQYVNGHQAAILNLDYLVPPEFPPGQPFLAAAAPTPPNWHWPADGIADPEARQSFSLGTCNGCHAGETFPRLPEGAGDDKLLEKQVPAQFTHVRPRRKGEESQLSPFLTGWDKSGDRYFLEDPTGQPDSRQPDGKRRREFHDLGRRALDLAGLVQYGAIYELVRPSLQMMGH